VELWIVLVIVLLLIAFVILLKVLRSVVIAVLGVVGLFVVLLIAGGIVLYVDASNLKSAFEGDKLFVLTKDGEVKTGLVVSDMQSLEEGNLVDYLTSEEVGEANSFFAEEEYGDLRGDNDLLIVFRYRAFNGTEGLEFEDLGVSISYEEIGLILEADTLEEAVSIMLDDEGFEGEERDLVFAELLEEFGSVEELKAVLLMFLFGDRVMDEGPRFLSDNYVEENLIINPEFITIRLVERIPGRVTDRFLGGLI